MKMINNNEENSSTGVSVKYSKKVGMGLLIVKEVSTLVGVTLKVTQTDKICFSSKTNYKTACYFICVTI